MVRVFNALNTNDVSSCVCPAVQPRLKTWGTKYDVRRHSISQTASRSCLADPSWKIGRDAFPSVLMVVATMLLSEISPLQLYCHIISTLKLSSDDLSAVSIKYAGIVLYRAVIAEITRENSATNQLRANRKSPTSGIICEVIFLRRERSNLQHDDYWSNAPFSWKEIDDQCANLTEAVRTRSFWWMRNLLAQPGFSYIRKFIPNRPSPVQSRLVGSNDRRTPTAFSFSHHI